MSRTIVTISVPIGSSAYDSINNWRANKRNVSEIICDCIANSAGDKEHIEAFRRRVASLEAKIQQYENACSRGGVSIRKNRRHPSKTYFSCDRTGEVLIEGSFGRGK